MEKPISKVRLIGAEKPVLTQFPSEHGQHMVMLTIQQKQKFKMEDLENEVSRLQTPTSSQASYFNKQVSEINRIIQDNKPKFRTDFALNTQINCSGDFNPDQIMNKQMPWKADDDIEEERILSSRDYNFTSELRSIIHQTKVNNQVRSKIQNLRKQMDVRAKTKSQNSSIMASPLSPTKKNKV